MNKNINIISKILFPHILVSLFAILSSFYAHSYDNTNLLLIDIIISKVGFSSFWIFISIYIATRSNYLERELIDYILIFISILTFKLLLLVIIHAFTIDFDFNLFNFMTNNSPSPASPITNNPNVGNITDSVGDAAILTTALKVGSDVAKNVPSLAGKITAVTSTAAVGLGIIAAKKVLNNTIVNSSSSNTNQLLSLDQVITSIFELTGNNALDLLIIVNKLHQIKIIILIVIILNVILLFYLNVSKIEEFLNKYLSNYPRLSRYLIRLIKAYHRMTKFNILYLLFLILIADFQCYNIINIWLLNIDNFIDLYFKK
uniref:Uncharacterized protein n=1 Tax=Macrolepiota fuliginosa TaxID=201230 RepID=A0A5Q0N2I7_9AGAR|nr:hypothetical protein [Macrolepiota fuliginosa]QFZ98752.1 hypothetical protein [Macrolepiota fuliginosa]